MTQVNIAAIASSVGCLLARHTEEVINNTDFDWRSAFDVFYTMWYYCQASRSSCRSPERFRKIVFTLYHSNETRKKKIANEIQQSKHFKDKRNEKKYTEPNMDRQKFVASDERHFYCANFEYKVFIFRSNFDFGRVIRGFVLRTTTTTVMTNTSKSMTHLALGDEMFCYAKWHSYTYATIRNVIEYRRATTIFRSDDLLSWEFHLQCTHTHIKCFNVRLMVLHTFPSIGMPVNRTVRRIRT